jgi:hypothetical protein
MAFCPNCEAEYKEGITVCPDCSLELVDELTPQNKIHDTGEGEPVPLQSFKTSAEAEMVRELLDQNGVDERDLDRAVEIYQAYFDAESPAPTGQESSDTE